MEISNNVFSDNTASTHGGGLVLYEVSVDDDGTTHGYPSIDNNVFAYNETDAAQGDAVTIWSETAPSFTNNIIVSNESGFAVYIQNVDAEWRYNNVFTTGFLYGGISLDDLTGIDGNLSVDPEFVSATDNGDWTDDDFSLSPGSPMENVGDPAILDASDGTRSDMGIHGGPDGVW